VVRKEKGVGEGEIGLRAATRQSKKKDFRMGVVNAGRNLGKPKIQTGQPEKEQTALEDPGQGKRGVWGTGGVSHQAQANTKGDQNERKEWVKPGKGKWVNQGRNNGQEGRNAPKERRWASRETLSKANKKPYMGNTHGPDRKQIQPRGTSKKRGMSKI